MIRYRVSLSALVPLLLVTATACTVRVKSTAGTSANPGQRHEHVSQPAPAARHEHVSEPAPAARHEHVSEPAPAARHEHVSQPAPAHDACSAYTGTGCYWMETESGRYCWVPAEWVDSYEGCYAMDSCDGGEGQSGGGCYKWAESSHAERARWPHR